MWWSAAGGLRSASISINPVPAEVVGAGSSPSTGGTAGAKPLGTSDATVSSTGNPAAHGGKSQQVRRLETRAPWAAGLPASWPAPSGDVAGYRAMGFLPGDIITAVNGRQIKSASDAAFVQQQIKPGRAAVADGRTRCSDRSSRLEFGAVIATQDFSHRRGVHDGGRRAGLRAICDEHARRRHPGFHPGCRARHRPHLHR